MSQQLPKAPFSEQVFPYSNFTELERWFSQRLALRSDKKLLIVGCLILVLTAYAAPKLILKFLTTDFVSGLVAIGGAGAAAAAVAQQNYTLFFVQALMYLGAAVLLGANLVFLLMPEGIAIGSKGIRFVYPFLSPKQDSYIPLDKLESIELIRPPGKTSYLDDQLVFNATGKSLHLRLGNLQTAAHRDSLLNAIEKYVPNIQRSAAVTEALQRSIDTSYTELWLQALSAAPKRERLKPLAVNARLDGNRYEVISPLGSGGQGFAYLALDKQQKTNIVLKEFILPVYVDINSRRLALEAFENEARLLSQLDHPQVVKLLSFFVEDHRAYLALEHIDGKNLRQIVNSSGPLPEAEVLDLAKQMNRILFYLHGLSPPLIHRDFTPDNLILNKDGQLTLIDFNVAHQVRASSTGSVVGKQAYIAPEQFRGQATTASDIYSMGATLYFLLTGQDPVAISISSPIAAGAKVDAQLDEQVQLMTAIEQNERPRAQNSQIAL